MKHYKSKYQEKFTLNSNLNNKMENYESKNI